ncbi:hypothetical protein AQUCO_00201384v1 [Aquilegia coerulea]|uniref:BHLH domain-containing protein n=1 Tax=Aquilegia coerulea TaxID=218851 RepID=A0A2G5F7X5_AQUCA|nr:hypothetical protein AQUCO_00201384v1 [Aquilegia coerulea]
MAEDQGSEGSVANSSSTSNIWDLHGTSLSSWNNNNIPWHPSNPNSNSSCDEDISISNSFTNTSNHSGLSTDDSSRQLREHRASRQLAESSPDNHLWSKVLLTVGNGGSLHTNQDVGENFLEALSSKNLATNMFEPVCDYLKKMDNSWEYGNSTSYNNMERQLNSFSGSILEHDNRVNNLSNLVTDWSIAPPCPEVDRQVTQTTLCNMSLDSMDEYSESDLSQMKRNLSNSSMYGAADNSCFMPYYGHDIKVESQHQPIEASGNLLHRSYKNNNTSSSRCPDGHNSSITGDNEKYYYGMLDTQWFNTRNLSDVISFNGCLNKPVLDLQTIKPCMKASSQTDTKLHNEISSTAPARGSTRGTGVATEGKKKRSEESSETQFKKPKHETSTVSSVKVQVPKVKLTDRITALQQIVSPFGKTDTASVLQEAIGYIKFLQEQVQLLSNPYMKANANKDPWGMLERKDKAEAKFDLKSRGLCLVPISCTPQVYRENTGSDYWTPTYRGCLYR